MSGWKRSGLALLVALLVGIVTLVLAGTPVSRAAPAAQESAEGQRLYEERCAGCHGVNGDGQGPAAALLFIKPRDFTRDEYKIKSTEGDEFPSRDDLIQIISEGMPGSTMPAWGDILSEGEIGALADYIQTFGRFFSQEGYGTTTIEAPNRPNPSDESIERGRVLYEEDADCFKCHGAAGRGDGPSAFELADNAGNVIYPADLTQPWFFRGGAEPEDIYLRLRTGLTGSPMPSFADAVSEEDTWNLVNYVLSLSPEEAPEPAVLLVSQYVDGPLPTGLDDPAWDELESSYYPLTGQIMRAPRYYQPSVQAVMVRSLYNDTDVVFQVSWNDRTETSTGEAVDAMAVQFPQAISDDAERPYFVFGDPARAVYQWYWSADSDTTVERNANGLDAVSDQPEEQWQTSHVAQYQDGRWQVLFRRPLSPGDSSDPLFTPNQFIPVAFMVWDGAAGESGSSMGLTTWSQLYLPSPTPLIEYGWIPVAMLAVVAVESLVVWQVRRSQRT